MRRHEKLRDYDIKFLQSKDCTCWICNLLRSYLEQGYEITLQLVR